MVVAQHRLDELETKGLLQRDNAENLGCVAVGEDAQVLGVKGRDPMRG